MFLLSLLFESVPLKGVDSAREKEHYSKAKQIKNIVSHISVSIIYPPFRSQDIVSHCNYIGNQYTSLTICITRKGNNEYLHYYESID
jgi:hypothetical protein